jgi:hypothetical protein
VTLVLDIAAIGDWLRDAKLIGSSTNDDPDVIARGLEKMITERCVTRDATD